MMKPSTNLTTIIGLLLALFLISHSQQALTTSEKVLVFLMESNHITDLADLESIQYDTGQGMYTVNSRQKGKMCKYVVKGSDFEGERFNLIFVEEVATFGNGKAFLKIKTKSTIGETSKVSMRQGKTQKEKNVIDSNEADKMQGNTAKQKSVIQNQESTLTHLLNFIEKTNYLPQIDFIKSSSKYEQLKEMFIEKKSSNADPEMEITLNAEEQWEFQKK